MFAFAIKKVKRNTVKNHEDLLAKKRLMHFVSRRRKKTRLRKEEGDEEGEGKEEERRQSEIKDEPKASASASSEVADHFNICVQNISKRERVSWLCF